MSSQAPSLPWRFLHLLFGRPLSPLDRKSFLLAALFVALRCVLVEILLRQIFGYFGEDPYNPSDDGLYFYALLLALICIIPYYRTIYWRLRGIGVRYSKLVLFLVIVVGLLIDMAQPDDYSHTGIVIAYLQSAIPYILLIPWKYNPV